MVEGGMQAPTQHEANNLARTQLYDSWLGPRRDDIFAPCTDVGKALVMHQALKNKMNIVSVQSLLSQQKLRIHRQDVQSRPQPLDRHLAAAGRLPERLACPTLRRQGLS
ncbi:MAG: hypothetical protein ACKVP3_04025 [Hyphomicrobiaceae bacterium]